MRLPFINLEFFYEENVVGIFESFKYPTKAGEFRYQPNRGFGHYEMWKTIKKEGFSFCYYTSRSEKVFFKVEDSGKYGKLILTEFSGENIKS